jgi:hypothetical protein
MAINLTMVMINSTEEIGGIEFLYRHLGIYLPYIILTSIGTIIGTLGILIKKDLLESIHFI